jgi:hypothetical protein
MSVPTYIHIWRQGSENDYLVNFYYKSQESYISHSIKNLEKGGGGRVLCIKMSSFECYTA